ncbi:Argonaute-like protein [Kockovaella imperatae]|uniref:Argonaute-like protein n=1 Tax=Kockovaella imperatae TaxID=4999 RepID=A0A1Y1UL73_9TREE|nr:Argonaute-like protein [Kockovaella imperatae]ORX38808.1 Argonaute-like protein [Kockovaella imperatae]
MAPPKGSEIARGDQGIGFENLFASMKLDEALDEYHRRPGFGTSGRRIEVFANMFSARFKNQGKEANAVYHYDVEINPVVKVANQKKPRILLWAIWNQLLAECSPDVQKALRAGAYDMVKNMYSPFELPSDPWETTITLKEDGGNEDDARRRFKIVITRANVIDLNTVEDFCKGNRQTEQTKEIMLVAIQAMNVLFRQDPTNRFKAVGAQGRRFFTTREPSQISQGGVVYNGFLQSFRWTASGLPAIQLDTAYSAFVEAGNLVDVMNKMVGRGGGGGRGGRGGRGGGRGGVGGGRGGGPGPAIQEVSRSQLKRLNEVLRMAKFKVNHRQSSRIYTMRGLTTQNASELKVFARWQGWRKRRDGHDCCIDEEFPRLPCVSFGKKNYLPMECANLVEFNSIPFSALAAEQTADMIKIAAKRPPERLAMINNWRRELNYQNLPKVKAWGLEVRTEMMRVNARVLAPPAVTYGANKTARTQFGSWNLKGMKFARPGTPLKAWGILSFDNNVNLGVMQQFCNQLVNVLKASGCPVDDPRPILKHYDPDVGIKPVMSELAKEIYKKNNQTDPQLLIVILPRKDGIMYSTVKSVAAEGLVRPLVTQCLQGTKITSDRGLDQYLGNVSMKIHAKLGGVTHEVPNSGLDKTTMLIGADVSHPPAGRGPIQPSIAVTVAAVNGDNVKFASSLRLQEGRVEIIQDLANMVHRHLTTFQQNTKQLPAKIILFRDGVSEGQYGHCVRYELSKIKEAASRFQGYKPKITFIVCAKRHSMRFFATDPKEQDRSGNLPAGTVVDSGCTHPFAFDFYPQAHAGLQGTAKPTHYICVADENGFSADKLQNLCNSLCYTYARATRAVSLVPVAYYADIIAGKARDIVYKDDTSDSATIVSSDSGANNRSDFDELRLKKRLEDNQAFNSVAWYI